MSYRNPKIIEDRSGEILARGLSQGISGLAKGITDLGVLRKKEREQRRLQVQRTNKYLNNLEQKLITDPTYFNKGRKIFGEELMKGMSEATEYNAQRQYDILAPGAGGMTRISRDNAQLVQGYKSQYAINNEAAKALIGNVPVEEELAKSQNAAGNRQFYKADKDGSITRSETFSRSTSNTGGYTGRLENRGEEGMWYIASGPDGTYEAPAADLPDIFNNLIEEIPNVQNKLQEEIPKLFYDKNNNFQTNLVDKNEFNVANTNEKGEKVLEDRQILNTETVNIKREKLINTTLATVNGAKNDKQEQNMYLDDLVVVDAKGIPIDSEAWQRLDSMDQKRYVQASVDKTFFVDTKIKEIKPGEPKEGYYRVVDSNPIEEDKKGKKIGSAEQTLIDLKEDITTQFAQDIPIETAVDLALNLENDVVFTQNGFTIDLGEDEDSIIEEGKPAKRKLKSYTYNSEDPIKNKEAQNKLIDLVRKKYFSGQSGYTNAAKLVKDLLKKYKAKTN